MTAPNGWGKIVVGVIAGMVPLAIAGLVTLVSMRNEVTAVQTQVAAKADREVIAVQYKAIADALAEVNTRLGRLEARP